MRWFRKRQKEPAPTSTGEPWDVYRARVEDEAMASWDTREGTCIHCNLPMRLHPPGRLLRADPVYCLIAQQKSS